MKLLTGDHLMIAYTSPPPSRLLHSCLSRHGLGWSISSQWLKPYAAASPLSA